MSAAHPGPGGAHARRRLKTRWPLEDMLGADLVAGGAAPHRGRCHGCAPATAARSTPRSGCKVDSFSLLQALAYLAGRLDDEYEIRACSCA